MDPRTRRLYGSLVITIPTSDRVSTEKSIRLENVNCVNLNRFQLKRLIPIEHDLSLAFPPSPGSYFSLKNGMEFELLAEARDSPIASYKRSAVNFGAMIWCAVVRNPLDYNGYGCFCGLGGGETPLDDTDR